MNNRKLNPPYGAENKAKTHQRETPQPITPESPQNQAKSGQTMNARADFRMFTINEAAGYFRLPKHFIRQLVITNAIPSIRAGKKYLINEKILESYLHHGVACGIIAPQDNKPLH